jgi:hypothetical protein
VSAAAADPEHSAIPGRLFARAEDWLLAGWVALAAPAMARLGGAAVPFGTGQPLAGLLELAGFVGALACLATRSLDAAGRSGDSASASRAGWNVLDSGAIGPLVGGLMLVGASAFAELGLAPETVLFPTIVVVLALSLVQSRVPAVPTVVRRALVTPYLLSAGGLFWGVVHEVTGGIDFRVGAPLGTWSSGVAPVAGLLILCAAVYYAMLIYAPRQIPEHEGGPVEWLARFGLFLGSVVFGLGWLPLLGG